jgi:hypothetical protein
MNFVTNWTNLAKQLSQKAEVPFRPASPESLSALQQLGVPEDVLSFFRGFEPTTCAEIASVRLWPIQEMLAENKDYVPGLFIFKYGYIVFSTTVFGDAFCFDTRASAGKQTAPIVLISHDGHDWDSVTPEEIANFKKPTASNFEMFLKAFLNETIDIQPNYPQS